MELVFRCFKLNSYSVAVCLSCIRLTGESAPGPRPASSPIRVLLYYGVGVSAPEKGQKLRCIAPFAITLPLVSTAPLMNDSVPKVTVVSVAGKLSSVPSNATRSPNVGLAPLDVPDQIFWIEPICTSDHLRLATQVHCSTDIEHDHRAAGSPRHSQGRTSKRN
jgi:hypothetical protein